MNIRKLFLYVLVAGFLMTPAGAEVIFQAEPPPTPEKARLFELAPSPLSHDLLLRRFRSLAGNDNLRVERVPAPRGLAMRSGDLVIHRDATGTEFFANVGALGQPDADGKPPTREEIVRLADEFLSKHFPKSREGGSFELAGLDWHMSQEQDLRSGEISNPRAEEATAYMAYKLEDVLISGYSFQVVGEDVMRLIFGDGSVRGAISHIRNARPVGDPIPLLKYEEVRDELVKKLTEEAGASDAIVHRIEFGLFSRPGGEEQGFYQPAYVFYVSYFDKEVKAETAARIIPIPAIAREFMKEPLETPEDSSPQAGPDQIRWKAEPPQAIALLLPAVQKVRSASVGEDLRLRASQLQLDPSDIKETPRGLFLSDPKLEATLFLDANGAEFFGLVNKMFKEEPGKHPPLPEADAVEAALKWVDRFEGIDRRQLGNPVVRRLMNQAFDVEKQQLAEPTADEVIVEFDRVIVGLPEQKEPIPVIGHGGFVRVHMNNLGEVSGHHWNWARLGDITKLEEVIPFQSVLPEFERLLLSDLGRSVAEVRKIEFGFYERPEGFKQDFLQPAYLFTVEILDPETEQVTAKRLIPIPATPSLQEPLDDEIAAETPGSSEDARDGLAIPFKYGDVTADTEVDLKDVIVSLRVASGLEDTNDLSPAQMEAGRLSKPGENAWNSISLFDASRIIRSIFGLDDLSEGP